MSKFILCGKKLFFISLTCLFLSCSGTSKKEFSEVYDAQDSKLGTIKENMRARLDDGEKYLISYRNFKLDQHRDEVISTIQLNDVVPIEGKNLYLAFYSFSVGSDLIRESIYLREENGKYYFTNQYFSSYDDDPFGNGKSVAGKKLLEKAEKWQEGNEVVEWY